MREFSFIWEFKEASKEEIIEILSRKENKNFFEIDKELWENTTNEHKNKVKNFIEEQVLFWWIEVTNIEKIEDWKFLVELINWKWDLFYLIIELSTISKVIENSNVFDNYSFDYLKNNFQKIQLKNWSVITNWISGQFENIWYYSRLKTKKKYLWFFETETYIYKKLVFEKFSNEEFSEKWETIKSNLLKDFDYWFMIDIEKIENWKNISSKYLTFYNPWEISWYFWNDKTPFLFHWNFQKKENNFSLSCNCEFVTDKLAEEIYFKIYDFYLKIFYIEELEKTIKHYDDVLFSEPDIIKLIDWKDLKVVEEFKPLFKKSYMITEKSKRIELMMKKLSEQ